MRALLTLVLVCAALWSGYWFVGSAGSKVATEAAIAQIKSNGWQVGYSDLSVKGFPNRFDTTVTNLDVADTKARLSWQAPFFQVLALSYQPNHLIAIWPDRQRIKTPKGDFHIVSTDMRASAVVEIDLAVALDRATFTLSELAISDHAAAQPKDPLLAIGQLSVAVEHQSETPASYRLGLMAEEVAPGIEWMQSIRSVAPMSDRVQLLYADLIVTFDKRWDRSAIDSTRPRPKAITLTRAEARWGELQMRLSGEVTVGRSGRPSGNVTVETESPADILVAGVAAGLIRRDNLQLLENALVPFTRAQGDGQRLTVPLILRDGQVFLGPFALGSVPALSLP